MAISRIKTAFASMRTFSRENPFGFPVLLLLLGLVTYGVFISSLGFYWDDWPPLVVSHFADKSSLWQFFSYDRPFQSWTYYFLAPICRDSAIAWQLSAIFFRWTSALALYFTFLQVFPQRRNLLQWSAILFVVFPGFSDQYASVAYGSHFITLSVYGLSLLLMELAIKKKKLFWIYFPLSLILTAVHLFTMEYFVGLELLRPALIFILLVEPGKKKIHTAARMIKFWLPYIVVLGIYLYWRMVLYQAAMGGVTSDNYPYVFQDLIKTPLPTLVKLLGIVFADLRFLFISSWTDRLLPPDLNLSSVTFWLSILIGLISAALAYALLFMKNEDPAINAGRFDERLLSGLGFWVIFIGMIPLWSTLRQITIGKWSDRFAIPAMWGVVLVIAVFIFVAVQNQRVRHILFLLLVGLSMGYQIRMGNDYRKDFQRQERFYTELKWRIPFLEPGTALFSPIMPAGKEADYSFSAAINLMYSGRAVGESTNYWMTGPRYYNVNDLASNPATKIVGDLRIFHFSGSAAKMVSIYMPPTGCLWVIDQYSSLMPTTIDDFSVYGKLTDQNLITGYGGAENGLSDIFDFNNHNDWCFYFEQGDLAQSKGQYDKSISFYNEAVANHLVPLEGIEYLPFIRSYAAVGNIAEAVALTQLAYEKSYNTKPVLCQFWHDSFSGKQLVDLSSVNSIYNSDICPTFFPSGKQ